VQERRLGAATDPRVLRPSHGGEARRGATRDAGRPGTPQAPAPARSGRARWT
jgi:hypothetical protein